MESIRNNPRLRFIPSLLLLTLVSFPAFGATICVDVPDAISSRVRDAMATEYGYEATIDDGNGVQIPNPQTKSQFVKATIADFVKQSVISEEANKAAQTARQAAITKGKSELGIS